MLQRDSVPLKVYVDGILSTAFEVQTMQESTGCERLDIARLLWKNATLENREFYSSGLGNQIEIVRDDTEEVLHWGKLAIASTQLTDQAEEISVISRADKFLLGNRLAGIWIWNPLQAPSGGIELTERSLVFNPLIDGKLYGNMNSVRTSEQNLDGDEIGHPLFLDPESVRTPEAVELQSAGLDVSVEAVMWPLSKCIHYLLQALNPTEPHIANPTLEEIEAACDDDNDLIRNVAIHNGAYLAEALDQLLEPLGYYWRIDRVELGLRKFAFFRRGAGPTVTILHQPLGEALDIAQTNLEASAIDFNNADLYNEVTILGGFYRYEVSVELHRGWPAAHDDFLEGEYSKDAVNFYRDAWRKWVLNEAGDYIGLRTEIDGVFTTEFREQMEGVFGTDVWKQFAPRRRKFGPTLTLKDDKTPIGSAQGIEIEYHNPDFDPEFPEVAPEWLPLNGYGAQILEHECGIYFDSTFPPLEEACNASSRSAIRIRVTATIVSDKRLKVTATRQTDSPQPEVVPFLIENETEFRAQNVLPISKYYLSTKPTLIAVDSGAALAFAERVRLTWDLMDVGGALQLNGLDATDGVSTYEVGQRVTGILGKELSFQPKADSTDLPQIVGIDRNVMQQTTTLHLQRLKRPITFGGVQARRRRAHHGRRP